MRGSSSDEEANQYNGISLKLYCNADQLNGSPCFETMELSSGRNTSQYNGFSNQWVNIAENGFFFR
jgi:hypothetical protein